MATRRKTFFSFHYKPDNWRAAQVRNMGVVEGNTPVADNDWETVKRGGAPAIRRWIDGQMTGRSCVIVLIGAKTADRKWIKYEIERAWAEKKGLLGIYIHKLEDARGKQATKGRNPFADFPVDGKKLSSIVKAYSPPGRTSKSVYKHISEHIAEWAEEAIKIRKGYP